METEKERYPLSDETMLYSVTKIHTKKFLLLNKKYNRRKEKLPNPL